MMKLKIISIALLSIAVLAACGDKGKKSTKTNTTTQNTGTKGENSGLKLAFVNADTLNKYYFMIYRRKSSSSNTWSKLGLIFCFI